MLCDLVLMLCAYTHTYTLKYFHIIRIYTHNIQNILHVFLMIVISSCHLMVFFTTGGTITRTRGVGRAWSGKCSADDIPQSDRCLPCLCPCPIQLLLPRRPHRECASAFALFIEHFSHVDFCLFAMIALFVMHVMFCYIMYVYRVIDGIILGSRSLGAKCRFKNQRKKLPFENFRQWCQLNNVIVLNAEQCLRSVSRWEDKCINRFQIWND